MAGLRSFIAWWMGGAGSLQSTSDVNKYICVHSNITPITCYSDLNPVVVSTNISRVFNSSQLSISARSEVSSVIVSTARDC